MPTTNKQDSDSIDREIARASHAAAVETKIDDSEEHEAAMKQAADSSRKKAEEKVTQVKYFLVLLLLLGGIGLLTAQFIPSDTAHHLVRDVSITITAVSTVSLIYEYFLRRGFLEALRETVAIIIDERMPSRYTNTRNAGIVDVYPRMDPEKLIHRFEKLEDTTIRIHKIFMADLEAFESVLHDAVAFRNCTVQIMLLDPREVDSIKRRAAAVQHRKAEFYRNNICQNIEIANTIHKRLLPEKKGNFLLKLHKSFVGVSMVGWRGEVIVGFYLRERSASHGTQLKVAGEFNFFYKELKKHFKEEWSVASDWDFNSGLDPYEFSKTAP